MFIYSDEELQKGQEKDAFGDTDSGTAKKSKPVQRNKVKQDSSVLDSSGQASQCRDGGTRVKPINLADDIYI